MAMGAERSKPPLHNFNLPCGLKWGNQKFLRCAKVQSNGQISTLHRNSESIGRRREPEVVDGMEAMREKLMVDLQTDSDKIKEAIFKESLEEPPENQLSPALAKTDAADLSRPWNLRTRRAACKEPNGLITGAGGSKIDVNRINNGSLPLRMENKSPKLPTCAGASTSGEKRERVKFSVPLSRGEIEEDFMAMIGHRPPRRPKKRAKFVQKNLDALFPGLWLTEITPDLYKVPEDQ